MAFGSRIFGIKLPVDVVETVFQMDSGTPERARGKRAGSRKRAFEKINSSYQQFLGDCHFVLIFCRYLKNRLNFGIINLFTIFEKCRHK